MAQQASDAKSDYLSRIAHEIRTPMSALLNQIKSARQCADDNKELLSYLDNASDTANYMTAIVTDISEASISERMASDQVSAPFNLRAVLDSVSAIMQAKIAEGDLTYEVIIDDNFDPSYIGNKTQIQQVLINFLNNSVKYTKPGGAISMRVYEEPRRGAKARVCFVIADTGIGIKKEYIPDLFKPFTRENVNDENAKISMGLGLSVAYNQIMALEGDVNVESEEGKGSTFTIHVQLERFVDGENNLSAFDVTAPKEYNLAGCNVLVAEDNPLNRTILGALLANEKITYAEANDGEAAVSEYLNAPSGTFDCILMDMRMPKLDGIKATEAIRGSDKSDAKTIPIIGVSANGFADDIRQARKSGINEYTTKPIDRDSLLSAMSKLIRRKGV